jgi:hypothetical protein
MSQQLSSPDQEALAKFKICFGIQAAKIESAYEESARLTGEIERKKLDIVSADTELAVAKKEYDAQWQKIEAIVKQGKPAPKPNQRQTSAKESQASAEKNLEVQKEALKTLEADLVEAEKQKKAQPQAAMQQHVKGLTTRLGAARKTKDDIDKKYWSDAQDAFKTVDPQKIETAVLALDKQVGDLVGPIELKKKQDDVGDRLKTLNGKLYQNAVLLQEIAKDAEGADISKLTGDVERKLVVAEGEVARFQSGLGDLAEALKTLTADAALKQDELDPLASC